jgi:uncharacterized protein (DUF697 family)
LPKNDIENLQIAFDGRYNIERLLDILEEAILDFEAQMGLRMAARLTEVVNRLARHLNTIFSGISATVALTPIPVSDIYVLLIIQSVLVCLIASLSGRDISLDTAKEFIFSMGGIAGAGYVFRLVAQQASKFLNAVWPGSGSAVSSGIAALGTSAIGKAAITYYIDGQDMEEAKKIFEDSRKKEGIKTGLLITRYVSGERSLYKFISIGFYDVFIQLNSIFIHIYRHTRLEFHSEFILVDCDFLNQPPD